VRLRQPAVVVPDAYPDRLYAAELEDIAPRANRQKATILVKTKVLRPDGLLRPEMSAKVTFLGEPLPEGVRTRILVPGAALTTRDGAEGVFVVRDDGTTAFAAVRRADGAADGGRVEVAAGLVGGERVVLSPPRRLEPGVRVQAGEAP
jgi:multidrug efflux pump subunit AcrA (membrane-fusion protein)